MGASATGADSPDLDDSHLAFSDCVMLRYLDQPDIRATFEGYKRLAGCHADEACSEPRGQPDAWYGAELLVVFSKCRRYGAMPLLCYCEVEYDSAMVLSREL